MRGPTDHIEGILGSFVTRAILSVGIVLSLVLIRPDGILMWTLLAVFTLEAAARGLVLARHVRLGTSTRSEVAVLVVVILATLSFVPMPNGGSLLLLGRIARLLLLLTYWGPLARDFVLIALQRERLSQIFLVGGLALILTGAGAGALRLVDSSLADIDGDGEVDQHDAPYFDLLWWSVRQVLDPGNLVESTKSAGLLVISLTLTTGGLLLVAVLIGMGSSLVEDLVRAGRSRPVALSEHTVVLNISESTLGVLRNVKHYFEKQLIWRRVATQGRWEDRPGFLDPLKFRGFSYRGGRATDRATLELLDVPTARRVAILSADPTAVADAQAITAVMSARQLSQSAWIVVELNRPGNIAAALEAGQKNIAPVPARRLAALTLAQEIFDPGRAQLIQDFVSLDGHEIYTAIFGDGDLHDVEAPTLDRPFCMLRRDVLERHHCLLLGYLVPTTERATPWLRGMRAVLNPDPADEPGRIVGLIALSPEFAQIRDTARAVADRKVEYETRAPDHRPFGLQIVHPPSPRRIVVLGFQDDSVETIGQLSRRFEGCEITVVGRSEAQRTAIREAFLAEHANDGWRFEQAGPKRLTLVCAADEVRGTIHVRVADRFSDALFRPGDVTGPVGNVFDYDAALLLAERSDDRDPDGATTLGVLKMLDEWHQAPDRHLERVVVEIEDPGKSELLAARARERGVADVFAFVCTSTIRHDVLSQSFFVPGLAPVLHNLITVGEQEIFAYAPTTDEVAGTFGDLVARLGERSPPLVPLAVARKNGELAVNPVPNTRFEWSTVRTIYCLGTVGAERA